MAEEHGIISACDVQVDDERMVFPTDVRRLASYNWSSTSTSGQPRIIVPGAPLNYLPPTRRVFGLSRDADNSWFGDLNAINMSPYSDIEPLLDSLKICAPDVEVGDFDLVADKVDLMKLLRFCRSPGDRDLEYHGLNYQPFKFFVHAIGENSKENAPTLVFSSTTAEKEGETYSPGFGGNFHDMLTELDPATPADAVRFQLIRQMRLDGLTLLVRSGVGARDTGSARASSFAGRSVGPHPVSRRRANNMGAVNEALKALLLEAGQSKPQVDVPSASAKHETPSPPAPGAFELSDGAEPPPSTKNTDAPRIVTSSAKESGLECIKSGELIGDDAELVELRTANGRFGRRHNWKDFLWTLLLGGAQSMMLGIYQVNYLDRNKGLFRTPENLGIEEVKSRANMTGSSSMVYLANTLREVLKAAHELIASSSSSKAKDGKEYSPGVVVEFTPGNKKALRVRLAVPEDGAIPP